MIRRFLKWSLLVSALVTVILVGALVWVVRGGYANGLIRLYVADELTGRLGEPCTMDAIEGDPLGNYRILGLHLGALAEVDSIEVRYRLSQLLLGKAVIDQLRIVGVKIQVATQTDTIEADHENWWAKPPSLSFSIGHLELVDGTVLLESGSDAIRDIAFDGAIAADDYGYRLRVDHYGSVQLSPSLTVSNLNGLGVLANGDLRLRDLVLETEKSRLFFNGDIKNLDQPEFDLAFRADVLALSELASVGLVDLPDKQVQMAGKLQGTMQDLSVAVTAENRGSKVQADVHLLAGFVSWEGNLFLKAFDPGSWSLPMDQPLVFDFEGTTQGQADSTGLRKGDLDGQFSRLTYGRVSFDTLKVVVAYDGKTLDGKVEGGGGVGWISAQVLGILDGQDIAGKAEIDMRRLNVALFPQAPPEIGELSGYVSVVKDTSWYVDARLSRAMVSGKRYSNFVATGIFDGQQADVSRWGIGLPDSLGHVGGKMIVTLRDAQAHVRGVVDGQIFYRHLLETELYGRQLDVHGDLDVSGKDFQTLAGNVLLGGRIVGFGGGFDSVTVALQVHNLDSMVVDGALRGASGLMELKGLVALAKPMDLAWQLRLDQMDSLARVFDLPIGGLALSLAGGIKGTLEKPKLSWVGQSDSLAISDVPMRQFAVQGQMLSVDSIAVSIKAGHLSWADRDLSGVFLDATRFGGKTEFLLGSLDGARDRIYTWGRLTEMGDGFRVVLDSLHVQVDQVALYNDGPLNVSYSVSKGLQIDHFALSGPAGKILAQDHPDFKSTIEVQLRDLDLRPWVFLSGIPDVDGILSGDLALSGALASPLMSSEWVLTDGHYQGVHISEIKGSVSYGQGRVLSELFLQFPKGDPVELVGSFPVGGFEDRDNRIYLNVRSDGFDLATLDTVMAATGRVSGALTMDLAASGTFDDPVISGSVSVNEGQIFVAALNQTMPNVTGVVLVDDSGQSGTVNLTVGKPNSGAKISGRVDLQGFDVKRWDMAILAKDFQAIGLPELRAVIDGHVTFSGTPTSPQVQGKVAFKQADIHLIELTETPGTNWEDDPFLSALKMQVRVSADRQVWVRDPDLQVEISGDVDVVKDGGGLRVYGALNSRRGFYQFQNRRLRIESGEIGFQGREEIDPNLDIRALTEQRLPGEAQPIKIYVHVGGTLTYPEISLTSDPAFEEGDILSMLVTGVALTQVGDAQSFNVGDQALGVALGVAVNQLSQRLGNELKLDLFEVDLGGGNVSRVRVGKYFGSRFFVSYAQDIASVGRELGVEFEMGHHVTLEAKQAEEVQAETQNPVTKTSLGVFWKKEW